MNGTPIEPHKDTTLGIRLHLHFLLPVRRYPLIPRGASGIVASFDKAPVSHDGNVQGQPTDYIITLNTSLDPNVEGCSLVSDGNKLITTPLRASHV